MTPVCYTSRIQRPTEKFYTLNIITLVRVETFHFAIYRDRLWGPHNLLPGIMGTLVKVKVGVHSDLHLAPPTIPPYTLGRKRQCYLCLLLIKIKNDNWYKFVYNYGIDVSVRVCALLHGLSMSPLISCSQTRPSVCSALWRPWHNGNMVSHVSAKAMLVPKQ